MSRSAKRFLSRFSLVIAALMVACTADRRVAGPTFSLEDCDIEPEGPAMEGGSLPCMLDDADPSAPGLFTTWSEEMCVYPSPFNDADGDGVEDSCERATAAAFAPMLIFSSQDCNWDHGLNRMGGEYYYAVEFRTTT